MNKRTTIIAEAGVNHNGNIDLAKKLIDAAAIADVDYVKFQTFNANKLVTKNAEKADYQKENTGKSNDSQFEMLKKLELSKEMHFELISYCKSKGVEFLSTGFDLESIEFLSELELDFFKIPSGEITNLPYLEAVAKIGKPVVISTGMADMDEIEQALNVFLTAGIKKSEITILHCNTEYPTPMKDVNLNAMKSIKEKFDVSIGYSDHTLGIEIPIAAVAMGASVIEKHFTLDNNMEGPDHKASLEPDELSSMVKSIRNIEYAMGNGIKEPSESEKKNKDIARKSIVAKKEIKKGELFSKDNLTIKRPGKGISPMKWYDVIGEKSLKDYQKDDLI